MLFTVRSSSMSLGSVDLPTGILVAARLRPSSEYGAVAEIVRAASEAFLHLGLFDAVAPMLPPIPLVRRQWRRALSHAARLQLVLEGPDGTRASTDFVNLLEAPADHDVIVLASFVSAHSRVGAPLLTPSVELGPGNPPDSGTWDVML